MKSPSIHKRQRILDPEKKAKLCDLVRESHSIEHAAEWLDVSIRTVQRERNRDEDFDYELRLALQATPDPMRLMETAARTHWRAAAWLLERTRPEEFAKRPANTARDYQVEAARGLVLEAVLEATPPEQCAGARSRITYRLLSPKTPEATADARATVDVPEGAPSRSPITDPRSASPFCREKRATRQNDKRSD